MISVYNFQRGRTAIYPILIISNAEINCTRITNTFSVKNVPGITSYRLQTDLINITNRFNCPLLEKICWCLLQTVRNIRNYNTEKDNEYKDDWWEERAWRHRFVTYYRCTDLSRNIDVQISMYMKLTTSLRNYEQLRLV